MAASERAAPRTLPPRYPVVQSAFGRGDDDRRAGVRVEGPVDRVGGRIDALELRLLERCALTPGASREPDAARADRQGVDTRVRLERRDDVVGMRVDVRDGSLALVQNPSATETGRDQRRLGSDTDTRDDARAVRVYDSHDSAGVGCCVVAAPGDDHSTNVGRRHEHDDADDS